MANLYIIPSGFFSYNLLLEFFFAVITLVVSLYAFRIYKLSEQKQSKFFAVSFLFFSVHYFIQSFLNFAIKSELGKNICIAMKIQGVNILNLYGVYSYLLFFMLGLVTLTYMALKIKSARVYILLVVISVLSIFLSQNKIYMYYFTSSILLIFICEHYLRNYLKNRQVKTLLVMTAFMFLLFSNIHFIFAVNHSAYFIVGRFLELGAYLLILLNLFIVLKDG